MPRQWWRCRISAPALTLLNRLQEATGGAVEAFEYMPDNYMRHLVHVRPDLRPPLGAEHPVTILVEIGATSPRDATPGPDGLLPVVAALTSALETMAVDGLITDATIAASEGQRRGLWAMREAAAEIASHFRPKIDNDICVPLDRVPDFLNEAGRRLVALDPGAFPHVVGHLGDGNLHYTVVPASQDPAVHEAVREMVEDVVLELRGSFSAEHGIGLSKLTSMSRRKDPVALSVMRRLKAALDPKGLMNPGKVLPPG